MPDDVTTLDIASFVLALIALLVSTGLAAIKGWETWFRRSRLEIDCDWIQHRGSPVLTFVLYNSGWKRDGAREIRFGLEETPDDEGWFPQKGVWERLPLMLDVDEISSRFYLETQPASNAAFDVALREGRIPKVVIENGRGRRWVYDVPAPPRVSIRS